jgi:Flp pilus assembly protein TadG
MHRATTPKQLRRSRAFRRRAGAELLEFTFTFLPFLCITFVLLDIAWGVFVKGTLDYAVRAGVRQGITITGTQATAAGSDLTTMVKSIVQQRALGILNGASGLSKIKVHYYQPPPVGSTAAATDVSTQSNGNTSPNIMQVSVEGYSLRALLPRIFSWKQAPDLSPTTIGAVAADVIEPSHDVPPIGVAP